MSLEKWESSPGNQKKCGRWYGNSSRWAPLGHFQTWSDDPNDSYFGLQSTCLTHATWTSKIAVALTDGCSQRFHRKVLVPGVLYKSSGTPEASRSGRGVACTRGTNVACTRERLVGDGRMYTRASSQLHANRRRAFFAYKKQWKSKLVVYVPFLSAAMRGSWFKQAICAAIVATTRE